MEVKYWGDVSPRDLQPCLYAGDTKIWQEIKSYKDQFVLQSDIISLHAWSIENRMTFHLSKCKAHIIISS